MIDVGEYLGRSMCDVLGKSGILPHQNTGNVLSDGVIFMDHDEGCKKSCVYGF